jgi:uncharacterized protein (DUF1810 family)
MTHDLERFVVAQNPVYADVLSELRMGRKRTHWMRFIFPQIDGLGSIETAKRYSIKSASEAREYLTHPILGKRLRECAQAVADIEGKSAFEIFGSPDDMKFRSSLTLFAIVSLGEKKFLNLLRKYHGGNADLRTMEILMELAEFHDLPRPNKLITATNKAEPAMDQTTGMAAPPM